MGEEPYIAGRPEGLYSEPAITSIRKPGAGFSQLTLKDGKLVDPTNPGKKDPNGTLTAVSNEDADTQDKILNILEQTYNLHADARKQARFQGFTQGL